MMTTHRHNPAWLSPGAAQRHEVDSAKALCLSCPQIGVCAVSALRAGDTLDGSRITPATDVMQAGMICRGDAATARALAEIAGVPVPDYRDQSTRAIPPRRCAECEEPMVGWSRSGPPPGFVMHRGRGFCTHCRTAYNAALRAKGTVRRKTKPPMRSWEIPKRCTNCQLPMIKGWSRKPKVGEVVHDSKGRCTSCRDGKRALAARIRAYRIKVVVLVEVLEKWQEYAALRVA